MKPSFIFFPSKCLTRQCGNAFVGPGYLCEQCDDARLRATLGDLARARRASIRKRLGLDQQDRPDTGSVGGRGGQFGVVPRPLWIFPEPRRAPRRIPQGELTK